MPWVVTGRRSLEDNAADGSGWCRPEVWYLPAARAIGWCVAEGLDYRNRSQQNPGEQCPMVLWSREKSVVKERGL